MGGEVTLKDALEQVEANNVKERAEGLANLKHVLLHNKHNSTVDTLGDASFHRIYEVLFRVAVLEKSAWLKAHTTITRSSAENRLSASASALRQAVDIGTRSIKLKTVRALLDHVIETLLLPNGELCTPLALDYAKTLVILLSYQPHVEHLGKNEWERTTLFCAETINNAQAGTVDEEDAAPGAESRSAAEVLNGLSHRSSRSHFKESAGSQGIRSISKQVADEMVSALSQLTAAPNAPIREKGADLLWALINFLKATSLAGRSHQSAFAAIGHILACTRTEDIALTKKAASPLLRLIRHFWPQKSVLLKDEMLTCLLYLKSFIIYGSTRDGGAVLRHEVSALLESMRTEYGRRLERDQLRLDDLRLATSQGHNQASNPEISNAIFRLRCTGVRAEHNWALVNVMATLYRILSRGVSDQGSSWEDDENGMTKRTRKRPKLMSALDDLLLFTSNGPIGSRVCALQTLAFLVLQTPLEFKQIARILDQVLISSSDESTSVSCWSFLTLAACAVQPFSADAALAVRWSTVWQLAHRTMSNALICRSACYTLYIMLQLCLVAQTHVADLVHTITTSMDLSGPTMLADSVLRLLRQTIKASQQASPASSLTVAENVLGWLSRTFTPSRFEDKAYAATHILYDVTDVITLIKTSFNHPGQAWRPPLLPIWDAVAQAWLFCKGQHDLVAYLLLSVDEMDLNNDRLGEEDGNTSQIGISMPQARTSCEAAVLNYFISEIQSCQDLLTQWIRERPKSISLDMFKSLCVSCTAMCYVAYSHACRDSRRQIQLQRLAQGLLQTICNFTTSPHCGQEKVDAMLIVFSQVFTITTKYATPDHGFHEWEKVMCKAIYDAMIARRSYRGFDSHAGEDDLMDLDDPYESQDGGREASKASRLALKSLPLIAYSALAVCSKIELYVAVVSIEESGDIPVDQSLDASARVVEYILGLPETNMLACHTAISDLPLLGLSLKISDAERLLEYCAETFLPSYSFERSEVAIGAVLSIVSSLTPLWSDRRNQVLYELGVDMYNWYTTTALEAGVLSPRVQNDLAEFLLRLCHADTDYPHEDDVPSARTSLFNLLRRGGIVVQFHLADRVSTIFSLFVLSAHGALFDDLQQSLPAEADWDEGLAMRLLFLARLASAWHSLLRQCVYYIFETAARIKNAVDYAAHCIAEMARGLRLSSSKELFRLFAPQLLHTWLESHTLTMLPFAAFGYQTMDDLLRKNQAEITAQLLMRGKDDQLQAIATTLKTSSKELCKKAFARCAAYSISWDIQLPTSEANIAPSETRLRTLIGSKEEYKRLLVDQFPAVMGSFYLSMQQDDLQDKWLERRPAYKAAATAMEEIRAYGHSTRALPASQQPSFKSKYLTDQIERLCRRTGHNPADPWTASSLTLTARMLFDCIEDALGPLHACLGVRKLRVLISMSGQVALAGYPLLMLLRSLRPFLSDSECADDAMGIFQYLLHNGQQNLKEEDILDTHGLVLLMILQMREHSGSKQESTTQESQHQATVQHMQRFISWLVKSFLGWSPLTRNGASATHQSLHKALATVMLPGNARSSSSESALLLLLLDQQHAKDLIIPRAEGLEALLLLTKQFVAPVSNDEDCLGSDEASASYAPILFQVLQQNGLNDSFVLWASNVLGRAFASTGIRPIAPQGCRDYPTVKDHDGIAYSQATIASRLVELMHSTNRHEAGLADFTLRKVSCAFRDPDEAVAFEQMLPEALVPVIADGTFGYEPAAASMAEIPASPNRISLERALLPSPSIPDGEWLVTLVVNLCSHVARVSILPDLCPILTKVPSLAADLLAPIIHLILADEATKEPILRTMLSKSVSAHLVEKVPALRQRQQSLLSLILYLRGQPLPGEATKSDRLRWLEIDHLLAADTATRCEMPTCALLFAESAVALVQPIYRGSTRASLSQLSAHSISSELLLLIFKQVDEPDSFYGVEQAATLDSVLDRLDYERNGYKSLMFRSARMDSETRAANGAPPADAAGIISSLSVLNLNSLTYALVSQAAGDVTANTSDMLDAARKLQIWDLAPPETHDSVALCFTAFQELSRLSEREQMLDKLRLVFLDHVRMASIEKGVGPPSYSWYSALATLTEIGEVMTVSSKSHLHSTWHNMQSRQTWMHFARYEDCQTLLSCRQTLFSVLSANERLLDAMHLDVKISKTIELESLLNLSKFARNQGVIQEALSASTRAGLVAKQCNDIGVHVESPAQMETAKVLWAAGETTTSVKMLHGMLGTKMTRVEESQVGRSGLLAQLAHQLAEARLESPDDILSNYLKPAIKSLGGRNDGEEAGNVFFEFASFCDQQLQNPGNLEDFTRVAKLRLKKAEEIDAIESLLTSVKKSREEKDQLKRTLNKEKQWFEIDDAEFQRLKANRDTFVQQSLQNYLLALRASDSHDICALRFFALWLENAAANDANTAVSKFLPNVPSWKFVVLLNQLMSRLEDDRTMFQNALKDLARRLCSDHPHHSLHHLYAMTRKPSSKEIAALSRYNAAMDVRRILNADPSIADLQSRVFKANGYYDMFAKADIPSHSSKIAMKDFPQADKMAKSVAQLRVPPITINLPLKPDGNYTDAPLLARFNSTVMIMSGLSKPKTLAGIATNGKEYRQLFKGGNDDLRQDAIMEQVFQEVSKMLRKHKATRQRNLHVNTYKVIPLTTRSGVIEWVPNSIPIDKFLRSAHERYHPQDMSSDKARDIIRNVEKQPTETRVKEYQKICARIQPVMRHFFFERFNDPDEWFQRRTAYTRTTASISMLGHVLGLGDRHCQNIVLDEKTGEVVHIDLGVAFEAGRVLPIPEVVPFRLTRDIVDGMGITKTEGVFRRCCEFTMDALREDTDTIMTLLNVLRYDPLYSWTLSPLRAKRVQDQETDRNAGDVDESVSSKKKEREAGEADRALSIVEKKLSKTLSTSATVNELIQQATDERNLARLFAGWSAYY